MDLNDLAATAAENEAAAKAAAKAEALVLEIANDKTALITMVRYTLGVEVDPADLVQIKGAYRGIGHWALPVDGDRDTATMAVARKHVGSGNDSQLVVAEFGLTGLNPRVVTRERLGYSDRNVTSLARLGEHMAEITKATDEREAREKRINERNA